MNPMDFLKNLNMDEINGKLSQVTKDMENIEVTGEAGGGFVKVTINGKFKILNIEYEEVDFIKDDLTTFKDLIIAAQNDASEKMSATLKSKFTSQLIPGMF